MDDDAAGQQGAASFLNKLGRHRCRLVSTRGAIRPRLHLPAPSPPSDPHAEPNAGGRSVGPKDANDALVLRVKKEAEH